MNSDPFVIFPFLSFLFASMVTIWFQNKNSLHLVIVDLVNWPDKRVDNHLRWGVHHRDIWVDINVTPTIIMSPSFPKYWRKSFWMFFSLIFMSLGWAAGRILLSYLETKLFYSMETSSEIIIATKEDSLLVWSFIFVSSWEKTGVITSTQILSSEWNPIT